MPMDCRKFIIYVDLFPYLYLWTNQFFVFLQAFYDSYLYFVTISSKLCLPKNDNTSYIVIQLSLTITCL